MKPTRILLVDDHRLFREGIHTLLAHESDMEVVAQAENGVEALKKVEDLEPEVVLMDVSIPEMNGIEATRRILAASSGTAVVALSMHIDKPFIEGMLQAGALGYVLKTCAADELKSAIRTARTGQMYLCPQAARVIVNYHVTGSAEENADKPPHLTPRERETLQLIAEGKSVREIASRLNVSTKTVETHRSRIMEKLELRSVAELTKYAVKIGLTPLDQ